ncbi:MAG: class I SAM-dependent methyltransferase [Patescibacteria group bacterium]|nr:class I SAM-dependent methyltransferase [Patescibacteria group bacterium]
METQKDRYIGVWITPESRVLEEMVGRKGYHDLDAEARDIAEKLDLNSSDVVLDLCCGNGLITWRLAKVCKYIHGVDFSEMLIRQAEEVHKADNIAYHLEDAVKVHHLFSPATFSKCVVVLAFQHFEPDQAGMVLEILHKLLKPKGKLFITGILDVKKKLAHKKVALLRLLGFEKKESEKSPGSPRWISVRSKMRYLLRHAAHFFHPDGKDNRLGWWWEKEVFRKLCTESGFDCIILYQPKHSPHAHYRFDALLAKR